MAYRANPFLDRMSERTTSDQEFVRRFSPKIIERIPDNPYDGGVHIFRSAPGGGKTTLLRAQTPSALRAFWNARQVEQTSEAYQRLLERGVFHDVNGPQLLGVYLSCASGYADLPPGATPTNEGYFRALLDCRIVLRALRSLANLLRFEAIERLNEVRLTGSEVLRDLKTVPLIENAYELLLWAEQRERSVYAKLDGMIETQDSSLPMDMRFEGILWLQGIRYVWRAEEVAPMRLLMIDDLHKLRKKQRALLIEEVTELRLAMPVWLAERNIVLGEELLSQGVRQGRDIREYSLEQLWTGPGGNQQFLTYAKNILDRRLDAQNEIPTGTFVQYLRNEVRADEMVPVFKKAAPIIQETVQRYSQKIIYRDWIAIAQQRLNEETFEVLLEFYSTRILIARDEAKRQLTLDLDALPSEELEARDSPSVQGAAEIMMNEDCSAPYYFGIERLCSLATFNVEELLSLAAVLYEGVVAQQILRRPELLLSPQEQEKLLKSVAKQRRDFIPKSHTGGPMAQRLLDSIGIYCRSRTFVPTAPYAPGVTGVRLSQAELAKFRTSSKPLLERLSKLERVLAECVAENLLIARSSAATVGRDSGTVFYLNRSLCLYHGLPLQFGGWQDISMEKLLEWMDRVPQPDRKEKLEL
jgi:hypothetical protein